MWWIYSMFDPNALQNLHPREFTIITKEGNTGLGTFDLPKWHKREGEHIIRDLGLNIKYYQAERESEQALEYVREAVKKLTGEYTATDISEWIKETYNVEIHPSGVGHYLRRIGYTSKLTTVNGKSQKIVKPIRE